MRDKKDRYTCTCGKTFEHIKSYVTYETIKGRRVRRLITKNDGRYHEGTNPGHRVTMVLGPRI